MCTIIVIFFKWADIIHQFPFSLSMFSSLHPAVHPSPSDAFPALPEKQRLSLVALTSPLDPQETLTITAPPGCLTVQPVIPGETKIASHPLPISRHICPQCCYCHCFIGGMVAVLMAQSRLSKKYSVKTKQEQEDRGVMTLNFLRVSTLILPYSVTHVNLFLMMLFPWMILSKLFQVFTKKARCLTSYGENIFRFFKYPYSNLNKSHISCKFCIQKSNLSTYISNVYTESIKHSAEI